VTIDTSHPLRLSLSDEQPVLGMRGIEVKSGSGQKGYFEVHCTRGICEQTYGYDEERITISIGLATREVDLTKALGYGSEGLEWHSHLCDLCFMKADDPRRSRFGELGYEDEDLDEEVTHGDGDDGDGDWIEDEDPRIGHERHVFVKNETHGNVRVRYNSCLQNIFSGRQGHFEKEVFCRNPLMFYVAPAFTEGDTIGMMVDCSGQSTLMFFVNGELRRREVMSMEMEGVVLFPAFQVEDCGEINISSNPNLPTIFP